MAVASNTSPFARKPAGSADSWRALGGLPYTRPRSMNAELSPPATAGYAPAAGSVFARMGVSLPSPTPPTTIVCSARGRASHGPRARFSLCGSGSGSPRRPTRRRAAGRLPISSNRSRMGSSDRVRWGGLRVVGRRQGERGLVACDGDRGARPFRALLARLEATQHVGAAARRAREIESMGIVAVEVEAHVHPVAEQEGPLELHVEHTNLIGRPRVQRAAKPLHGARH